MLLRGMGKLLENMIQIKEKLIFTPIFMTSNMEKIIKITKILKTLKNLKRLINKNRYTTLLIIAQQKFLLTLLIN